MRFAVVLREEFIESPWHGPGLPCSVLDPHLEEKNIMIQNSPQSESFATHDKGKSGLFPPGLYSGYNRD